MLTGIRNIIGRVVSLFTGPRHPESGVTDSAAPSLGSAVQPARLPDVVPEIPSLADAAADLPLFTPPGEMLASAPAEMLGSMPTQQGMPGIARLDAMGPISSLGESPLVNRFPAPEEMPRLQSVGSLTDYFPPVSGLLGTGRSYGTVAESPLPDVGGLMRKVERIGDIATRPLAATSRKPQVPAEPGTLAARRPATRRPTLQPRERTHEGRVAQPGVIQPAPDLYADELPDASVAAMPVEDVGELMGDLPAAEPRLAQADALGEWIGPELPIEAEMPRAEHVDALESVVPISPERITEPPLTPTVQTDAVQMAPDERVEPLEDGELGRIPIEMPPATGEVTTDRPVLSALVAEPSERGERIPEDLPDDLVATPPETGRAVQRLPDVGVPAETRPRIPDLALPLTDEGAMSERLPPLETTEALGEVSLMIQRLPDENLWSLRELPEELRETGSTAERPTSREAVPEARAPTERRGDVASGTPPELLSLSERLSTPEMTRVVDNLSEIRGLPEELGGLSERPPTPAGLGEGLPSLPELPGAPPGLETLFPGTPAMGGLGAELAEKLPTAGGLAAGLGELPLPSLGGLAPELPSLGGIEPPEMPMAPSAADLMPETTEVPDAAEAGGALGQITEVDESASPTAPAASPGTPNVEAIADQVFERVRQRLIIERERMGGNM